MSVDKLVDSTQLDTDLTSVANAIRAKSGGSSQLAFPAGFVSEIQAIPTGGGSLKRKDVNFVDYDGSLIASYTAEDFASLSELPANPSHTGLIAQGWNWALADAKTHVASFGYLEIGQKYTSNDGKTRVYVTITQDLLRIYLRVQIVSGTASVNWGDGTTESLTSNAYTGHTYSTPGDYVIEITTTGSIKITAGSSYANYTRFISRNEWWSDNNGSYENQLAQDTVKKVIIGSNVSFDVASFGRLRHCEAILNNVTTINTLLCRTCTKLITYTIPNGVTTIGTNAFNGCADLSFISIPKTVTTIEEGAFQNCYNLFTVSIPSGVTSIGKNAFSGCSEIEKLLMPNTLTTIGETAFSGCQKFKSLTIPSSVTSIGVGAFNNCWRITGTVTIPNQVTKINNNLFYGCTNINEVALPSTITSIGNSAFYNCTRLRAINIPSNVTSIGSNAFQNCYVLKSITIPDGVTSIPTYAFSYCCSLTSITVPASVTSIGTYAFSLTRNIMEYHFLRETPPTLSNTNAFNKIRSGQKIYVPYSQDHSILEAYKTASNWSTYASYIEEEPQ